MLRKCPETQIYAGFSKELRVVFLHRDMAPAALGKNWLALKKCHNPLDPEWICVRGPEPDKDADLFEAASTLLFN